MSLGIGLESSHTLSSSSLLSALCDGDVTFLL